MAALPCTSRRAIACVLHHQGCWAPHCHAAGAWAAPHAVPVPLAALCSRPCSSTISALCFFSSASRRVRSAVASRQAERAVAADDEEPSAPALNAADDGGGHHDHSGEGSLADAASPEGGGLPSSLPAPGSWAGMVASWPVQELEPALYIVPTPIGNLADITLRALTVLRSVNLILAEDTRHSRQLLTHFGIRAELMSCHAHNERLRVPGVLRRLQQGEPVALVSDAGTPGISDPGHDIICAAIQAGVKVVPLPGPSAFVAALVASGLSTTSFTFVGFLPAKKGARRTRLAGLRSSTCTLVFYASPHAVLSVLTDLAEVLGPTRRVCVAREVTKRYEELLRCDLAEAVRVFTEREPRGEFCLVVDGADADAHLSLPDADAGDAAQQLQAPGSDALDAIASSALLSREQQALTMLQALIKQGATRGDAAKQVASRMGIKRKQLYALAAAVGAAADDADDSVPPAAPRS